MLNSSLEDKTYTLTKLYRTVYGDGKRFFWAVKGELMKTRSLFLLLSSMSVDDLFYHPSAYHFPVASIVNFVILGTAPHQVRSSLYMFVSPHHYIRYLISSLTSTTSFHRNLYAILATRLVLNIRKAARIRNQSTIQVSLIEFIGKEETFNRYNTHLNIHNLNHDHGQLLSPISPMSRNDAR